MSASGHGQAGRDPPARPSGAPRAAGGRRIVLVAALAAYAAVETTLVLHHEPWRDEADAWLVARDASVRELFHLTGHMGTPSLWYLVQMPFAKHGFPYRSQGAVNLAFAVGAGALLLFAAPLPVWIRVLLLFGRVLGYEFPVIARPYALSALLLFAAASLDARRRDRPLRHGFAVGLLGNTTTYALLLAAVMAGLLGLECAREKAPPRRWGGFGAAAAGVLLALAQVMPPAAGGQMRRGLSWFVHPFVIDVAARQAFFPTSTAGAARVAVAALLVAALLALARKPRALLFLAGSYASLWYVYTFVYALGLRHFAYLLLALVAALWIAAGEPERASRSWGGRWPSGGRARRAVHVALGVSLVASCAAFAAVARQELAYDFSDARIMARYLDRHGLRGAPIAAHQAAPCSSILPYLPGQRFWYAAIGEEGTHMKWDAAYRKGVDVTVAEAVRATKRAFPGWWRRAGGIPLLLNQALPAPEAEGYRLAFRTPARSPGTPADDFGARDERFFLYVPIGARPALPPNPAAAARAR